MAQKKSTQVDLLHGPIMKNIVIFMIPIFISQAFQQLYNAVDTALVGNILGENSLAAIGACATIFELIIGFAMNMANGFSLVIGRAFGAQEDERIRKAVAGSIVIGVLVGIMIMIVAHFGLVPLLRLINTPEEIFAESLSYVRIIAMFCLVTFAYNLIAGILRAIGNSVMPLVFLIVSSLLNIALDYIFMAKLNMGVAGAAYATVLSQGVSAVLSLIYMLRKEKELIPHVSDFKAGKEMYADLAGQGFAMAFMGSIVTIGSIILQSGINGLGTEVIAGHIAARKVYSITMLPFIGMSVAISTFVSQNRGANQGDRILTAMKDAYIFDVAAAAGITVLLHFAAPSLVRLISGSSSEVILYNGSRYLYVVGPFYAVLGMLIQTRFALQGLGSKWIPLISSVIECGGKILFNYLLIPRFGYTAVIWCEPLIWCAMEIQLYYSYRKNPYMMEVRRQRKEAR